MTSSRESAPAKMGVLPQPVKPLGIRDLDEGDLWAWNLAVVFGVYEFRARGGCGFGLN
jgi:hypothetical protein